MITSRPSGASMRPKWMLSPCANSTAAPGSRFGRTPASHTCFCTWSGTRMATSCAPRTVSAIEAVSRPASSAACREPLPSRRPTCTSTPESRRFSACACPWLPKPTTATLPSRRSRLPSRWIVAMSVLLWSRVRTGSDECLWLGTGARARRPAEADAAGADELLEPVRPHELLEGVDLFGGADELEDDRLRADVGDACVERLREGDQVGALAGRRRHLEQRELALDRLARGELLHAEDVDELVDLLLDLLERMLLAVHAQRDARDVVPLGRADREALDVERAPREHARHAGQRAW